MSERSSFSVRQAKDIVADLFEPRPAVYWTDFLVTAAVAYGAAALYLWAPLFSLLQIAAGAVSGLALFRAGVFIHEIAHMPRGVMRRFRIAWNLLYGIPTLTPSFMYKNHVDHHNWRHYGTAKDGEYVQLAAGPASQIVWFLAQIPVLPLLAVVRFLVLTPLSLLHPRFRRVVLERASSYVCNPRYRRTLPAKEKRGWWLPLELACCAALATVLGLAIAGTISWTTVAELYVLATFAVGLNWVRNLGAHRYRNDGAEMTYLAQLEDSINITGSPITATLLFPVGLRYHALHHLFPSMPYHNMSEAHARLMAQLPADSPYRVTACESFSAVVAQLWRDALAHSRLRGHPAAA